MIASKAEPRTKGTQNLILTVWNESVVMTSRYDQVQAQLTDFSIFLPRLKRT
jgi:hypothetical protein